MIVLYIILGIIAALLIAGLFIPKGMKATREIVINKPNAEVFNYIKHLKIRTITASGAVWILT